MAKYQQKLPLWCTLYLLPSIVCIHRDFLNPDSIAEIVIVCAVPVLSILLGLLVRIRTTTEYDSGCGVSDLQFGRGARSDKGKMTCGELSAPSHFGHFGHFACYLSRLRIIQRSGPVSQSNQILSEVRRLHCVQARGGPGPSQASWWACLLRTGLCYRCNVWPGHPFGTVS